ncbi:helix-turn-helix domain-containing protein, partial [Mycoplasmopsis opalescens]|uniref:transcriptional regulator n=1 Tax=Mycoplasmopsis opalescens TaxID=114886 RepID=UPI0004A72F63
MSSLTEFGKFFRLLRINNNEVLIDAQEFLGVSVAFISNVENGIKEIPDDWADKIVGHYNLDEKQKEKLIQSIENSKKSIKIDLSKYDQNQKGKLFKLLRSFNKKDKE